MANILGMAAIRINGREIKTEGKSTLNPGGYARQQHMGGGKVWGNSRKMAAPSIKLTIAAESNLYCSKCTERSVSINGESDF